MNITEEQKQEADRIVEKYYPHSLDDKTIFRDLIHSIYCAIQDRQSVLDENESVLQMLKVHGDVRGRIVIHQRILSLTAQIEYLKNKT